MSQVSYGTITITDTTDIERIYVEYCRSTSNQLDTSVNPPVVPNITVAWSENTPPWVNGQYIWQRSVVKKSGNVDLIYGTPVCLTGAAGATGAEGRGLTDTTTEYCNYGTGEPADNYSGWVDAPPTYDSSKPNYWVKITNTYSVAPISEIIKYKDEALTKTVSDSAIANSVAQHASEDAQGALSQAAAAQQQVTQVDTLLGGHFSFGDALPTKTPSGARIVEQLNDSPTQWLHNVNIGANGIQLRYNEAVMAQLAATNSSSSNDIALKFYQPPTISGSTTTQGNLTMALKGNALTFYDPTVANGQSVQATLDANGLKLLKGGVEAGTKNTNDYIYVYSTDDATNHTFNINSSGDKSDWRIVAGQKFGVDKAGNLYANNARISGAITVQAGSDLSAGLSNYSTTTQMNQAIGNATEDMATTEYVEGLGYQTAQDVSGAVTSGIQNASVTDLSDGSNYSTTADMNTAINTATGNLSTAISNTYATKTEAVVKEQRVYRRFTSAQSTFSGLNTWVTSGNGYAAWSTSIPQLTNGTTTYPFLYMSTQTQTATQAANSGTGCSFTTPQLNAMTTVIDGNSIIANSIAAGKINVENLQALSADMGTLTAGKITKGNNTIDFDNGTLEFKNQSTWTATTQGIKYDSTGLAIKGTITATSLTIDSGATVSGLSTSDISGINNYATVTAAQGYANDASYLVEIEVRDVNYTTPTATLFAHVYYKGGELTSNTNPAISSISFQWKKVVVNSGTYSVIDITNATNQSLVTSDLDTTYICVISNNS